MPNRCSVDNCQDRVAGDGVKEGKTGCDYKDILET